MSNYQVTNQLRFVKRVINPNTLQQRNATILQQKWVDGSSHWYEEGVMMRKCEWRDVPVEEEVMECWLWHKWSESRPIYNHEGEFSHHQRECKKCGAREERWTDRVTGEPKCVVTERPAR